MHGHEDFRKVDTLFWGRFAHNFGRFREALGDTWMEAWLAAIEGGKYMTNWFWRLGEQL